MNKPKTFLIIALLAVMLAVPLIAYAKTITVDGNGGEWISAEIVVDDDNADNGGGGFDLDALYFTNNTTTAFFRVDTVGNTDLSASIMIICMNADGNNSTGNAIPGCDGTAGYEYAILIDPSNSCGYGATLLLYDNVNSTFSSPASLNRATSSTVTEVEIGLADIGISADGNLPIIVTKNDLGCSYSTYDVASGTAIVGAGSPTAVEVQSFAASNKNGTLAAGGLVLALVAAGGLLALKRKETY